MTLLRRHARLLGRAAISLGLVLWLATLVDWSRFWEVIRSAGPWLLGLSVCLDAILIGLSTWRWSVLYEKLGPPVQFTTMLRLYLMGVFLNHFLPTSVGGDVGRSFGLWHHASSGKSRAVASVLAERFIGFGTFMVAALFLLPWMHSRLGLPLPLTLMIAGAAVGFVVVGALMLAERLTLLPRWISETTIGRKLVNLRAALATYRRHGDALWRATGISLLAFVVAVANLIVTAAAFDTSVTVLEGTLGTPLITLGALIPFSLGGLGVIEGIYVYFFDSIGVAAAVGLVVALVMRIKSMLFGAMGALVFPETLQAVFASSSETSEDVRSGSPVESTRE